jgi:hypothetical protein
VRAQYRRGRIAHSKIPNAMQIAARRDGKTWRPVPPRAANHLALIRRF